MAEVINLTKRNQKINLTKEDGTAIKRVFIGINWGKNTYSGEDEFDLDLLGFLTDTSGIVKYPQHLVNWLTYNNGQKWDFAKFSGDNLTGDDTQGVAFNGQHFDEGMEFYADKIPDDMTDFYIGTYIHLGQQRLQNFGMVSGASMDMYDMDDPDNFHVHYDFCRDEKFEDLTAVEIGKFVKQSNGVSFRTIEAGFSGGGIELYKSHGLDVTGC